MASKLFSLMKSGIILALLVVACSSPKTTSPQELAVENDGITLYVRTAGDPASGNVLIAIHGGPGMTHDYMLSLEQLAGPSLVVATYDQRGVGRSSSPSEDPANYSLARYAQDLEAVRQAIGVDQVILFGHSWGGIVAQSYATLYPEHVASIIMMGSGPPTREKVLECQQALVERIRTLMQQGILSENPEPGSPAAEKGYLLAYFSDPNFWFSADDPGRAPLVDERTTRVNDLTWAANVNFDLIADLAGLKQRVLNLWGEADPVRPVASPEIITALSNADLETVVLSNCGHFWQECPEQFFTTVRAFLDIPRDK